MKPIGPWRKYSPAFKRSAVDRLVAGERATDLARELLIRRKFLYAWRDQGWGTAGPGVKLPPKPSPEALEERKREALKKKVAALERVIGQQAAELDFFAAALRNITALSHKSGSRTGAGSTKRSKPS